MTGALITLGTLRTSGTSESFNPYIRLGIILSTSSSLHLENDLLNGFLFSDAGCMPVLWEEDDEGAWFHRDVLTWCGVIEGDVVLGVVVGLWQVLSWRIAHGLRTACANGEAVRYLIPQASTIGRGR